jgi:hypothetical protein
MSSEKIMCVNCKRMVFAFNGKTIDNKFYCNTCVASLHLKPHKQEIQGTAPKSARPRYWEKPQAQEELETIEEPESIFELFTDAYSYPVKDKNKWLLLMGGFFVFIVGFFHLLYILLLGYFSLYFMDIVEKTARGDDKLPDWPDISGSLFSAWLRFSLAIIVSFGPAIFYFVAHAISMPFTEGRSLSLMDPLYVAFNIFGIIYYPMAMATASVSENSVGAFIAMNPIRIFSLILKNPIEYFISCIAIAATFSMGLIGVPFLSSTVPILGGLASNFLSFYLYVAALRLIGLVYRRAEPE